MPVILDGAAAARWLEGGSRQAMLGLLKPFDAARMKAVMIGKRVNSPANDDPAIIEPISA